MKYILLALISFSFSTAFTMSNAGSNYYKVANTGLKLKEIRKVGVGFQLGGVYGSLGGQIDLNFTPDITTAIGFGLGEGYKTFNLQFKKAIGGVSFLPYITGGYTRWFTSDSSTKSFDQTNPSFLGRRFLSAEEKKGRFVENFIYPGIGIQFIQPKGKWAGTSIYAELILLVDMDNFVSASVGSLGYSYYF